MSRDLASEEHDTFRSHYGTGEACKACGNADVTIRIWERYGTTSKEVGGEIGPDGIVAALVLCEACGHGEVIPRSQILQSKQAA
ncbi:MAG: hypothetical protein ACR2N6_00840 [Miltoncostaeaceae bacterium]